LPASSLGLYVVAVTIGSGASLAASTIAYWVAFPILSNLPSGFLKTQILGRFMRLVLSATLLSALILFVSVPWLIRIFFGVTYGESADMARILIVAAIPWSCGAVFAVGFRAYNLPEIASGSEIVGLVVTALALLILLPKFGALGAAWASLLAYSATFLYMLVQSRQRMEVQMDGLFLPSWDDWYYLKDLLLNIGRRG
jgi:O-antigen/teichoic acid export membrane protein